MRFLADECCDFAAVRSLRAEGHDVQAISEFQSRSVDKEVMELALTENRILLTEDKRNLLPTQRTDWCFPT